LIKNQNAFKELNILRHYCRLKIIEVLILFIFFLLGLVCN